MKNTTIIRYLAPILLVGLAVAYLVSGRFGVDPPLPDNLDSLDPDVASLIRKTSTAVIRDKRNVTKRTTLGRVYEANDLHALARDTYQQVLEVEPDLGEIWFRLAVCQERLGDLSAAVESMERSIELEADFAASYWRLSMWLLDIGETDRAADAAERAIALDRNDPACWFAQAKVQLARRENEAAIGTIRDHGLLGDRTNGAFASFLMGRALQQSGKLEEARSYLEDNNFRPVWRDDWSKKLFQYQTGLARMRAQASGLVKQGRMKDAIGLLEKITQRDPSDVRSWNMLSVAYLQQQQFDRSVESLERSLQVDPDGFGAIINLSTVIVSAHKKGHTADLERALQLADKAIQLRPGSAKAHEARGNVLGSLQRIDESIASFEKAFSLDSRTPARALMAADMEIRAGRFDSAIERLRRLSEVSPDFATVHLNLANLLIRQGEIKSAYRSLQAGLRARHANEREKNYLRQKLQQIQPLLGGPIEESP